MNHTEHGAQQTNSRIYELITEFIRFNSFNWHVEWIKIWKHCTFLLDVNVCIDDDNNFSIVRRYFSLFFSPFAHELTDINWYILSCSQTFRACFSRWTCFCRVPTVFSSRRSSKYYARLQRKRIFYMYAYNQELNVLPLKVIHMFSFILSKSNTQNLIRLLGNDNNVLSSQLENIFGIDLTRGWFEDGITRRRTLWKLFFVWWNLDLRFEFSNAG